MSPDTRRPRSRPRSLPSMPWPTGAQPKIGRIGRTGPIGEIVRRGEVWFAVVADGGDRPVLVLTRTHSYPAGAGVRTDSDRGRGRCAIGLCRLLRQRAHARPVGLPSSPHHVVRSAHGARVPSTPCGDRLLSSPIIESTRRRFSRSDREFRPPRRSPHHGTRIRRPDQPAHHHRQGLRNHERHLADATWATDFHDGIDGDPTGRDGVRLAARASQRPSYGNPMARPARRGAVVSAP